MPAHSTDRFPTTTRRKPSSTPKQTIELDAATARSYGLDVQGEESVILAPVPNRKRGISMTRRYGQTGSLMIKGEGKNKKWVGRYYSDVSGQDERLRKAVTLGFVSDMTRSEARRKLLLHIEAEGVNERPDFVKPKVQGGTTFAQELRWWETHKLSKCKASYQETVQMRLKHIVPYFENMPLREIDERKVQEFITHLESTTYMAPDGVQHKLSAVYIRDVVGTLKRVIGSKASDWELSFPTAPKKEQRYFTRGEMVQIINAANGQWRVFFTLLAETGLRCGEAFGLHVEDLDLEGGRVFVRRSIWHGQETTAKTDNAYRAVVIAPELCRMLRAHLGGRTTGYVFKTSNGTPLSKDNTRRKLQSILNRLGIPKGGLHAFRHGRVSILQVSGVPGDLIKEQIGHSSLVVTARYTHFDDKFREEVAKRTSLLGSVNGDEVPQLVPDSPLLSQTGNLAEMVEATAA